MKVTCGKCQTAYSVAEDRVPLRGAQVSCPNCGGIILVPGAKVPPSPSSGVPAPEKDFSKTMSTDYSQIVQEEDDAVSLLAQAREAKGELHSGAVYLFRDHLTGETYPIPSAGFIIGRTGADLTLPDPEISRRHCQVKVMGDHMILLDLESTNGVHVRGEKVRIARLTPGQSFTIGNTTLEFTVTRKG